MIFFSHSQPLDVDNKINNRKKTTTKSIFFLYDCFLFYLQKYTHTKRPKKIAWKMKSNLLNGCCLDDGLQKWNIIRMQSRFVCMRKILMMDIEKERKKNWSFFLFFFRCWHLFFFRWTNNWDEKWKDHSVLSKWIQYRRQ